MTTANREREQVKSTEKKEEKMNARKALSVICVLVVSLVLALGSNALAGPPALEYMSWNDIIYDYELPNNLVSIVKWPTYEYSDPLQVGGCDPWDPIGNAFAVAESLHAAEVQEQWDDDGVPNNFVVIQPWPTVEWSDPPQPGGYDPWDPIGNSFGLAGNN